MQRCTLSQVSTILNEEHEFQESIFGQSFVRTSYDVSTQIERRAEERTIY